jgi:hypothetical protein
MYYFCYIMILGAWRIGFSRSGEKNNRFPFDLGMTVMLWVYTVQP